MKEVRMEMNFIDSLLEKYGVDNVVSFINNLNEGFDSFDDDVEDWSDAADKMDMDSFNSKVDLLAKTARLAYFTSYRKQYGTMFTSIPRHRYSYNNSNKVEEMLDCFDLDFSHHSRISVWYGYNNHDLTIKYTVNDQDEHSEKIKMSTTYRISNAPSSEEETKYRRIIEEYVKKYLDDSHFFEKEYEQLLTEKGTPFKITDKDFERMRQCQVKNNYSAAEKIGDKSKAIARFVAGYIIENNNVRMREDITVYKNFYHDRTKRYSLWAFLYKARELGATLGDILSTYDEAVNKTTSNTKSIQKSKCLPGTFMGWLDKNNIPIKIIDENSDGYWTKFILFPDDLNYKTEVKITRAPHGSSQYRISSCNGKLSLRNTGTSESGYYWDYLKFTDLKSQILFQI